jgi:hypothetical protein
MAHQWPRDTMKGKFGQKKCCKLWLTIPTQSFHFARYFTIKSDECFSILSLSKTGNPENERLSVSDPWEKIDQ